MKRILFCLIALIAWANVALAIDVTEHLVYTSIDGGTANSVSLPVAYKEDATSLTIPDTHLGLPVTTIAEYAFGGNITYDQASCINLESAIIGNNITTIGNFAFYFCTSLASIIIPDNVTTIGQFAFAYCYDLSNVIIGNSVTATGNYAFFNCRSLQSIVIPDNVTTISNYTFQNCTNLSSVIIGNSVTLIGIYAFGYCTNLTTLILSKSVNSLGNGAFQGTSLTSVTFYSIIDASNFGIYAFQDSYFGDLRDRYLYLGSDAIGTYIRDDVEDMTWVYQGLDAGLYNLEFTLVGSSRYSVSLPEYFRPYVTTATIPAEYNGLPVEIISDYAFGSDTTRSTACPNLWSVTLPNSITTIYNLAFNGCYNLWRVTFNSEIPAANFSANAFPGDLKEVYLTRGIGLYIRETGEDNWTFVESYGSLSGTVNNGEGETLEGVEITLSIGTGTPAYTDTTSASGTYSFPAVLPGEYELTATLNGYYTHRHTVTIIALEDSVYNFSMPPVVIPTGAVYGTVTGTGGTPLVGANISVTEIVPIDTLTTTTDSSGEYRIPELLPGLYTLHTTATGYQPFSIGFEIIADRDTLVDVSMSVVGDNDVVETPYMSSLLGSYPNPFNPSTTIVFSVGAFPSTLEGVGGGSNQSVHIDIYNIKGQKIRQLVDGIYTVGTHKVVWNGLDDSGTAVSSGVYFYRMKTEGYSETKKMMLLK
jgi:hypothetical protein